MDLSNISFTVRDGPWFVDIDCGYIGYGMSSPGLGDSGTVERLAHFLEWSSVPSVAWLRRWAKSFLLSIKEAK